MGALHRTQWLVRDPLLMTGTPAGRASPARALPPMLPMGSAASPSLTSSFLPRVPPRAASVAFMLGAPAVYKSVAAKICSRTRLAVCSLCYWPGCFLKGRAGPGSGGSMCRSRGLVGVHLVQPPPAPPLVPTVHRAASPPGLLRLSSPGVFACMSHNKGFRWNCFAAR